jgi:hypothetical protein
VSAATPQGDGRERRRHRRHAVELSARVEVDGEVVEGTTVDVSEGGVSVRLPRAPMAAKSMMVAIQLAELGWAELRGELVRQEEEGPGVLLAARFAAVATEGGPDAIKEFLGRYRES